MRLPHALIVAALSASVALSAQAPDRGKPPAPGPAPALKLPAIQKRQLANGLPVWIVGAARSAGRAGQPRRVQRQRGRSARQVRRDEPDDGDARGRRAGRARRWRLPTRSISSAPILAPAARSMPRRSACTCRSRGWPTRCRSWPTSRCGRRSRRTSSSGSASSASRRCCRRAMIRPQSPPRRSRESCTGRRTATARRWPARRKPSRPSPRRICARNTRRPSGRTTAPCSWSAISCPTRRWRSSRPALEAGGPRPVRRPSSSRPSSRRRSGTSTSSTSRARRRRRSASDRSACRDRPPTTFPFR